MNSPHLYPCLIIFLSVDRLSLQMKIGHSSETVTSAATDPKNPIRQGKDKQIDSSNVKNIFFVYLLLLRGNVQIKCFKSVSFL